MFSAEFWRGALERAIKTGAQFVLLVLGVGVGSGVVDTDTAQVINAFALDYLTLGGAFMGGVLFSVLTSLTFSGNVPNVDGLGD